MPRSKSKPRILSRLAFFQLLLLGLALASLWVLGLGPWLDARSRASVGRELEKIIESFDSETASLDPSDYAPSPVPDLKNAAHWALAGAAALVDDDGFGDVLKRFAENPNAQRSRETGTEALDLGDPAVRAGLANNEIAIEVLHRMAGLQQSDFGIDYERGPKLRLPPLDQLYAAGSLLGLNSVVAATDGRYDVALQSLRSLDALAAAAAMEAPRRAYVSAVYLERLFNGALQAVAERTESGSQEPPVAALRRLANQPPHAGGLCPRVRRMLFFDAAVRVAHGPDAELVKSVDKFWFSGRRGDFPSEDWVAFSRSALDGLAGVSKRCDDIHPLRGVGALIGVRSYGLPAATPHSSQRNTSHDLDSSDLALGVLQPELWQLVEIVRRARHRRLMAVVALTLLEESARRGVDPATLEHLPSHLDDPVAKELAACVEVQRTPGVVVLAAVRRDGCGYWIDDSLRWPLASVEPAGG